MQLKSLPSVGKSAIVWTEWGEPSLLAPRETVFGPPRPDAGSGLVLPFGYLDPLSLSEGRESPSLLESLMWVTSLLGCSPLSCLDFFDFEWVLLLPFVFECVSSFSLRLLRFAKASQWLESLPTHRTQGCVGEQSRHFRHLSWGEFSLMNDEHFFPGFLPGHLVRLSDTLSVESEGFDIPGNNAASKSQESLIQGGVAGDWPPTGGPCARWRLSSCYRHLSLTIYAGMVKPIPRADCKDGERELIWGLVWWKYMQYTH
jgi:hypothetical protein